MYMCIHLYIRFSSSDCSELGDVSVWNPMEDDYLSGRNLYVVDDEDAGTALDGFSQLTGQ